mmetsp:Transcript_1097/g.4058  ORF Transcript_1097/g.4058 Transcript_1097/m.4058 type:complete len:309 (+) Transcript_1097:782-1708(+)
MHDRVRVLITGGSGYLGQHLVAACVKRGFTVYFTFCSECPSAEALSGATPLRANLATGEGVSEAVSRPIDVCINCAALSAPAECERDPAAAEALNVPSTIVRALKDAAQTPLFVHLSTDQVYSGEDGRFVSETVAPVPVNAYGRSKVKAEEFLASEWPRDSLVVLRSSIIFGPEPPSPLKRRLFLQWLDSALAANDAPPLYVDEHRCPIFVNDIEAVIVDKLCAERCSARGTFNLGGPERLSRFDMGLALAAVRGHARTAVREGSAKEGPPRPLASPADISVDTSELRRAFNVELTPWAEALRTCFPP